MEKENYAAVICDDHGQQMLDYDEYYKALCDPWSRWTCPYCGANAEFDDAYYEQRHPDPNASDIDGDETHEGDLK